MATSMFRASLHKYDKFLLSRCTRHLQTVSLPEPDGTEVEYPEIKPKYPSGEWGNMEPKLAWSWEGQRKKLSGLKTAEEKIKMLTERQCIAWKYNSIDTTPNLLRYQCHVTKTHLLKDPLPVLYDNIAVEESYEKLKRIVIQSIIQEHEMNRQRLIKQTRQVDQLSGERIKNTVQYNLSKLSVRCMLMNLLAAVSERKDISECRIDYDARVSAFWNRHGIQRKKNREPPKDKKFILQQNCMFYGEHEVEFQIRKQKPLPEFVPRDFLECHSKKSNPTFRGLSPKVFGQFRTKEPLSVTAGFNDGDPNVFNHLSIIFTNQQKLRRMKRFGDEFKAEADKGYAMSTGFLSTLAQAHMLGFNEYEELTYPITSQTILTDGREFILSAYQLNTTQLWKDNFGNNLQNICWVSNREDLYKEYKNGQLVEFNDDLFRKLLKFFLIESSDRNGIDLAPNLEVKPFVTNVDIPYRKVYEVVETEIQYDKS